MSSFIGKLLSNNLFEKCVDDSFISLNCIFGSLDFVISMIIISLNCYGFYKLVKFFHKVNFETSLILMNIIQIIIMQLLLITSYGILIELFNLVQIGMLTWIIRKFNILIKNPVKYIKKNLLFILLNILNFLLTISYIVQINIRSSYDYNYPIILFHASLSFLISFILIMYSCSLIDKMKQINKIERESLNVGFESSDNINIFLLGSTSVEKDKTQDFIFYYNRERQIKPLYKINFFCIFIEFSFVLSILLESNISFQKESNKIIPLTTISSILYHLFILVCIINTLTNFFCFFWRIKSQYKTKFKKDLIPENRDTLIDSGYINRQKTLIENEKKYEEPIEEIIDKVIENNHNKRIDSSLLFNSFEDLTYDKKNNSSSYKNQENIKDEDEKDNSEKNVKKNNDLLNNEIINRESIPIDIDSHNAINRISRNTISIVDEDK